MNYQINENEWKLLIHHYQKNHQRLSPIIRTTISEVLSTLEKDKTITEVDQANAINILLTASVEEETNISNMTSEQSKHKSGLTNRIESKDLLILIDSIKFFLQYNEAIPDKRKQTQRQKGL